MDPEFRKLQRRVHGPSRRWWALTAMEFGNFVVYRLSVTITLLPARLPRPCVSARRTPAARH